jgi:hypothetical protein
VALLSRALVAAELASGALLQPFGPVRHPPGAQVHDERERHQRDQERALRLRLTMPQKRNPISCELE